MEWYDEGYLKLYGDLRRKDPYRFLAKQYLVDTLFDYAGPYKIGRETYNGCTDYPLFNTLTLEQARKTHIDVVICSVHENEPYFGKLKEFYPNAKFIRQVGNDLDTIIDENTYPNLLSSATAPFSGFTGHKVLYRQEFPMDLFIPEEPRRFNNIYSFQNDIEQFEDTWTFWTDLKHKLRDFRFQSFGVGNEQGKIYPKRDYVKKVNESTFILQSKGPWEGYGHVIHNAMALGRPMVIKYSDYAGKLAAPLLLENETYFEMDDNLPDKLQFYSNKDRFKKVAEKCRQVFAEYVNFDREFIEIKEFFNNLR